MWGNPVPTSVKRIKEVIGPVKPLSPYTVLYLGLYNDLPPLTIKTVTDAALLIRM
jgi:hypothetical protein